MWNRLSSLSTCGTDFLVCEQQIEMLEKTDWIVGASGRSDPQRGSTVTLMESSTHAVLGADC